MPIVRVLAQCVHETTRAACAGGGPIFEIEWTQWTTTNRPGVAHASEPTSSITIGKHRTQRPPVYNRPHKNPERSPVSNTNAQVLFPSEQRRRSRQTPIHFRSMCWCHTSEASLHISGDGKLGVGGFSTIFSHYHMYWGNSVVVFKRSKGLLSLSSSQISNT